jgi:hypothetical protein
MDGGEMVVRSGGVSTSAVTIIVSGETLITPIAATTISQRSEKISERFVKRAMKFDKIEVN